MGTKRTNEQAEDMPIGTVIFGAETQYNERKILHKVGPDKWDLYFVIEGDPGVGDDGVNTDSFDAEHIIVGEASHPQAVVQFGDFQQGKAEDIPPGTVHIPGAFRSTLCDGSGQPSVEQTSEPEIAIKDSIDRLLGQVSRDQRVAEITDVKRWIHCILLELKVLQRNLEHHTHGYSKPSPPPGTVERKHITTSAKLPEFKVGGSE